MTAVTERSGELLALSLVIGFTGMSCLVVFGESVLFSVASAILESLWVLFDRLVSLFVVSVYLLLL